MGACAGFRELVERRAHVARRHPRFDFAMLALGLDRIEIDARRSDAIGAVAEPHQRGLTEPAAPRREHRFGAKLVGRHAEGIADLERHRVEPVELARELAQPFGDLLDAGLRETGLAQQRDGGAQLLVDLTTQPGTRGFAGARVGHRAESLADFGIDATELAKSARE